MSLGSGFKLCVLQFLLFATSCSSGLLSNDIFVDDFDSTVDWDTCIKEIVNNNSSVLVENDLKILSMKKVNLMVTKETFLNGDYSFFPVYFKGSNSFKICNVDSLDIETSFVNYGNDAGLETVICDVVEKQSLYDFVEIKWKQNKFLFKTLAVFDKLTGELVYDNVLMNMFRSSVIEYTPSILIVSAEYESMVDMGGCSVSFSENGTTYASVSLHWQEEGHWDFADGNIASGFFRRCYIYKHDRLTHQFEDFVRPMNGSTQHSTFYMFTPESATYDYSGANHFGFTAKMCASRNSYVFTPSLHSVNEYDEGTDHTYRIYVVHREPRKECELLPYYMHSSYYN